jgi:glycosyltransferase involved in cell wall biosynthesis
MSRQVSLVVPVYNEAGHLEEFLQKLDVLELQVDKELIIVDDCSRDDSRGILRRFPFCSQVSIVEQPVHQGKGAALRIGIAQAAGDFIGIVDADFEYDMQDIPLLLEPLLADKADVVYGSRFKKTAPQVHRTFHYLINRFLTLLSNLLSGLYLSDMETCYKFFRADVIQNIHLASNRFGFEPEGTAKIARLQLRVMEIGVSYYPRNYLEGKKITWKDGLAAIGHIIYFNLCVPSKACFLATLPARYIPRGRNWL